MTRRRFFLLLLIAIHLGIVGCSAGGKVVKSQTPVTTKTVVVSTSAPTTPSPTIEPLLLPPAVYHVVDKGQTLAGIAKAYNVDVKAILDANYIPKPDQLVLGQKLLIPGATQIVTVPQPIAALTLKQVEDRVGLFPDAYWRTITLHHSATTCGDEKSFDRYHKSRKMGGLFYHFIICNGSPTMDGELEVGYRWTKQIFAKRPYDIQICVVGNFNYQEMTDAQIDTMVKLLHVLCKQFHIPPDHIRRHRDIKATECPGKKFPFDRIIQELEAYKE